MDIFVYYRVHPEHTEKCHTAIVNMQKQLNISYGIPTSLKRRVDQAKKIQHSTWMETYSNVPLGFIDILNRIVQEAALHTYIEGERHNEIFEDMPACA